MSKISYNYLRMEKNLYSCVLNGENIGMMLMINFDADTNE